MAQILFILNDPPYGTERSFNALRLAAALAKDATEKVRVFLIGEGASCAHANQKVPSGHYNVETMLLSILSHGGEVLVCSSCMDARGISDADLVESSKRGTMSQLAEWTRSAERILVF